MDGPWTLQSAAGDAPSGEYRARVRGCLLGGAVGDTLGCPGDTRNRAVWRPSC